MILILLAVLSFCNSCNYAAAMHHPIATLASIRGGASKQSRNKEEEEEMCSEIRHVLNCRLTSVLSGERQRQFSRKYRADTDQIDREYTIVSSHGRSSSPPPKRITAKADTTTSKSLIVVKKRKDDNIWPEDIMSLEITNNKKERKQLKDPSIFRLTCRALVLAFHFAPCISTVGLAVISSSFRDRLWYDMVASGMARSGPAFIKWGQWASTRSDMFPEQLCTALSHLHANAPSHSFRYTQNRVESSLQIPSGSLLQVFHSFSPTPLASGSIAQVHKAVLKKEDKIHGTPVAVKVRHPKVARLIDMDFRLMSVAANIADMLPMFKWLNVRATVEQFSHTMAAQAHLDVEAHHLEVLNYNFRNWDNVGFPRPFFASESVIMETFEQGEIVTKIMDWYDSLSESNKKGYEVMPVQLAKFLVTNGLSVYLKMLLVDNLMHADLHPGNIMLHVDSFMEQNPEQILQHQYDEGKDVATHSIFNIFRGHLTMVDAGMVAQLTKEESTNFIGMLSAVGDGDACAASGAILRFSSTSQLTEKQKLAFTRDMENLFQEKCKGYNTEVDVGEVLRGILNLIRIHHVRIDANYATLVVNALCVEGMAKRVCPKYNLLDSSKPLLIGYRKVCSEGECTQSRTRQKLFSTFFPLLYYRKTRQDDRFFRKLQKQQQPKMIRKKVKSIIKPIIKPILITGVVLVALSQSNSTDIDLLDSISSLKQKVQNWNITSYVSGTLLPKVREIDVPSSSLINLKNRTSSFVTRIVPSSSLINLKNRTSLLVTKIVPPSFLIDWKNQASSFVSQKTQGLKNVIAEDATRWKQTFVDWKQKLLSIVKKKTDD